MLTCANADERIATWYGESHRGKYVAWWPRRFNPDKLTCACWDQPFGTWLIVSHGEKWVRVQVTDRGPARRTGATLDLSRAAFARIAPLALGRIKVRVRVEGAPGGQR